MTHLDLFSGIGGFAIAAQRLGIQTTQFVESDAYCQKILNKKALYGFLGGLNQKHLKPSPNKDFSLGSVEPLKHGLDKTYSPLY